MPVTVWNTWLIYHIYCRLIGIVVVVLFIFLSGNYRIFVCLKFLLLLLFGFNSIFGLLFFFILISVFILNLLLLLLLLLRYFAWFKIITIILLLLLINSRVTSLCWWELHHFRNNRHRRISESTPTMSLSSELSNLTDVKVNSIL